METYNRHTIALIILIGVFIIGVLILINNEIEYQNYLNEYHEKKIHNLQISLNKSYDYNNYVKDFYKNKTTRLLGSLNDTKEQVKKLKTSYKELEDECNDIYKESKKVEWENTYLQPDVFKETAVRIAKATEYEMDVYDCTEFSRDLAHDLKRQGWDADSQFTITDCESGLFEKTSCEKYDGGHQIVKVRRIYIEAVSGNIIHPDDYKAYGINR